PLLRCPPRPSLFPYTTLFRSYRDTAHLDDVTLVLRGRGPYRVNPAHTNVMWVISHPDEVTTSELREFDAVFGASPRWCERVSRRDRKSTRLNSSHVSISYAVI